ncbi:hypothetical protein [Bartonella massiliensis]|uniref:hypothetical protein n=1 Tax=Bartonella massiliensis TaxID=929795 RepID=UPI003CCC8C78
MADSTQKVLKNTGIFCDFRLESQFVDSSSLDPAEIIPVIDVASPASGDVPSFSETQPHITRDNGGSIDSNSREKIREPSPSFSVDSSDSPLLPPYNDSDVFMRDVPNPFLVSLPPSLEPIRPTILKSHPVVPTSGSSVFSPVFELFSAPQFFTYILVPKTLFHAGLMDISNQNKQMQTLRTFSRWLLKINEKIPLCFCAVTVDITVILQICLHLNMDLEVTLIIMR